MKYSYEDVKDAREQLRDVSMQDWLQNALFTWQWWMLVAATIIPWILWIHYVDKKRIRDIFTFGLLLCAFSCLLDNLGTFFVLWGYEIKLIPLPLQLIPADFTVIPVTYMFIYQWWPARKTLIPAAIGVSAFFAYVVEPVFQVVDIYRDHPPWNHTLSFLGLTLVAMISRFIQMKITKVEIQHEIY